jgi:hypothetical protein
MCTIDCDGGSRLSPRARPWIRREIQQMAGRSGRLGRPRRAERLALVAPVAGGSATAGGTRRVGGAGGSAVGHGGRNASRWRRGGVGSATAGGTRRVGGAVAVGSATAGGTRRVGGAVARRSATAGKTSRVSDVGGGLIDEAYELVDKKGRLTRVPLARWSSLVARRAHNPKVVGSNPARATRAGPRVQLTRTRCPDGVPGFLVSVP